MNRLILTLSKIEEFMCYVNYVLSFVSILQEKW